MAQSVEEQLEQARAELDAAWKARSWRYRLQGLPWLLFVLTLCGAVLYGVFAFAYYY